ncbi:hypothetical protein LKO27_13345 [Tessaracoccus sp. OS52]|uniref:TadE family type IV pilus minor pilin n=1 Tax=Tessaracoccus sp. OS52 TaxID=2886691 RepID=UPI001D11F089|nr:TadE family type IV pilus minor pilin [Tessaracoccus sp. OS52]MCC2594389.1 hypothetical protein [Tessaracoccus sp. OS52]
MVTVELAVGFVTTTVLAAVLLGLVMLGVAQAACARTSSEVARQLARGDQAAAERAQQEAPEGARVEADDVGDGVEVSVTTPVDVFRMGVIQVSATSWARYEGGVAP